MFVFSERLLCTLSALTKVLNGVVSLLAVHSDRLGVGTSHSVANYVASNQDVGAEGRSPGHDDAVGKRSDVQRTGLVGYLTLCRVEVVAKTSKSKRQRHLRNLKSS